VSTTLTEVTVNVTQEHIDRGERNACAKCPVALALLAAIPGAGMSDVYWGGADDEHVDACAIVWIDGKRKALHLQLPQEASAFIAEFDDGLPVTPFTFTAEVI
jgi:hypothetical protein